MDKGSKKLGTVPHWSFALLLVVALVGVALLATTVTNALTGGQALEQLRSYYIYLPIIFNK